MTLLQFGYCPRHNTGTKKDVALVGEYVAPIYDEVKQRPAFIVQNRSHSDRPASPLVQDVPSQPTDAEDKSSAGDQP